MSNRRALSNAVKESKQPKQLSKSKDIILDPMGQWKHPGENTRIPSNNITMQGVNYPVWAVPNVGQPMMMQPGQDYNFPEADYVDEFPEFAEGGTQGDPGDGWKEVYLQELNEKLANGSITQKQYNYLKAKIDEYYNIEDQIGGLRKQLVSKQLPEDKFTEQYQALRGVYKQKYNENHGCQPGMKNCPSDEELDKLYPTENKEKVLVGNNEVTKYNDQGEIVTTVEPIYDYVDKETEPVIEDKEPEIQYEKPKLELEKPRLEDYDFPKGKYYPDKKKYLDWHLNQRYDTQPLVKVREKNIIRKEDPLLRFVTGYDKAKKNSRLYKEHREWDDRFKKELGKINSNPEDVKFPSFRGIPVASWEDLKDRKQYKKEYNNYLKNELPGLIERNKQAEAEYDQELLEYYKLTGKKPEEQLETDKYGGSTEEYKRGGGLKSKKYSRSLQATNKFFREHSFFEKPKKLSKKRIYDPNARYYQDGGLIQYAPGGASADPPDWLTKRGANVYFNPAYQNNFTGSVNTEQSYFNNLPVFKQDPAAVFGIEGSLSKNRNAKKEAGRGWLYDAYVGMPYSQVIGDNAQYKPSAGIKFDYENGAQDKKFRPHIEAALDYNMHTGPLASVSGGARYPITPWGNKLVKPGYGVGHIDLYGGFSGGAGAEGAGAGLNYGARIQGKYQPKWLDRLSRGSYFYGDAGIQFDPAKGKNVQKQTDQEWTGGQDQGTGEYQQMVTQAKDPGVKWGSTVYANVGIKKDVDDIKFKNNDRSKRIRDIEEKEKQVEYENYKQEEPKKEKSKKECPEGERRSCENCSCEPIEKHKHPRWLQDGGEQDGMNAMMKARLAYANEFGNPAAQRMINIPDSPYQFENGDTGTHYMASMDNYAVPQIQDENGQLMLGDYGPDSREAMRFDSDEDANYFAEHYKDVSPGFIEAELSEDEIQKYVDGGYIVEDISVPKLSGYALGGEPCQPCPDGTVPERTENGDCPCSDNTENLNFYKFALQERDAIMNQPAMWNEDPDMMNPDGSYKFCVDCLLKDYNDPDVVKSVAALINNGVANFPNYDMPDLLKGLEKYQIPMPIYQSNVKKIKREMLEPGQWAGVTPKLVQPGEEAFPLPQNKNGGQFELGDEVDELTKKKLEELGLGYTFEKI